MKITTLKRHIEKLGGTAQVETKTISNEFGTRQHINLIGQLNGYDVEMIGGQDGECTFYTVRKISKRYDYDPGADYNPGGYMYLHRLNELERVAV